MSTQESSMLAAFPIVGIGASAGGLEPLQRLFDGMPADCGMAFIVDQHLSPDCKSMMHELLSRHTVLPIQRADNEMEVRPNTIYLMPPKSEMIISGGRLLRTEYDADHGLTLPIDVFFRSLAGDVGPRAIGVILSGTGSDGARGIRAIHEAGGLVIVQSEASAQFNCMPRSALDTGIVDLDLPPEGIQEALLRYTEQMIGASETDANALQDATERVFELLRNDSGIDFASYKPATIARRIDRRLRLTHSHDLDDYVRRLREDPDELGALYKDLLIGVTGFFRDRDAFALLQSEIMPDLVRRLGLEEELRIWVPACATGEEAYSLAILAHEAFRELRRPCRLKIFATDVHRTSIEAASLGLYPPERLENVPDELRERYFTRKQDRFQISSELRGCIVFARHDVLQDAPFTRLHMLSCRNLLIYFTPSIQRKVLALFHFALETGGVLLLGPSETPGALTDELTTMDRRWKIYRKQRNVRLPSDLGIVSTPAFSTLRSGGPGAASRDSGVARAQQMLLERYAPPSLLLSSEGKLVHAFNGGARFLIQRDGSPSLNVLDLIQSELRFALSGALQRVRKTGEQTVLSGVRAMTLDGPAPVELTVSPVAGQEDAMLLLVTLAALAEPSLQSAGEHGGDGTTLGAFTRERLDSLEAELQYTRENLQATIEEMETSNEELQASNEALVSSNEELQSVNEELYMVNAEYQTKIAELTELTNDMNHLLEATEVHTIFLDHALRIRKFTPKIAETFNLLSHDIGRRIDSFAHDLEDEGLRDDLRHVLDTGERVEREVQDREKRDYLLRILPYRPDTVVAGVILTLVDISALKQTEHDLWASEARYRTFVQTVASILWATEADGQIATRQPGWEAYTGQAWDAYRGNGWLQAVHPDDRAGLQASLAEALQQQSPYELRGRLWSQIDSAYRHFKMRAAPVMDAAERVCEWVGDVVDIEDAWQAEMRLREREAQLQGILDNSPVPIYAKDLHGRYIFSNRATRAVIDADEAEPTGKTDYDLYPPDVADTLRSNDRQVVSAGEAIELEESIPHQGRRRSYLSVKFPLRDSDGVIFAIVGVSTDITERKLAEERDHLAVKRRDEFLAMMSHELRNPLGAILNATYAFESGNLDSRAVQRSREIIKRQALHMRRMLDDLLDATRISRGKIEIRMENVEVVALTNKALEVVRPLLEAKGLGLHVETSDQEIVVRGDADRIQQIQTNLLKNAAQFTAAGGTIDLEIRKEGAHAVIQVRDTGRGMAPQEQEKIFEMFYQQDSTLDRSDGGLGVGLALVRALVELHGGQVAAHSEGWGKGSVFTVTLPLAPQERVVASTEDPPEGQGRNRLSIVIVEDNDDSRDMLQMLLESRGHQVFAARDGKEGAESIIERQPDLALVDIGLPTMNGYEVVQEVRAACPGAPIYMVALTGYGRQEDRDAVMQAGFDEHIVKPIEPADLNRLAGQV